ncbi:chromobox protein homolog 5-like [Dysidea avara]|uniref:chromobox protein homolog 5-like n=1 Tax=Dysidea avara TaxID=196820 RepID=UPI00332795CF
MEYSRQSRTTASNDSGYYRRLAHEDSSDEDDIYEVERAVAKRVVKGEEQMLVTWTGFPVHTASWVPSTHVTPSVLSSYDNPIMSDRIVRHEVHTLTSRLDRCLAKG